MESIELIGAKMKLLNEKHKNANVAKCAVKINKFVKDAIHAKRNWIVINTRELNSDELSIVIDELKSLGYKVSIDYPKLRIMRIEWNK